MNLQYKHAYQISEHLDKIGGLEIFFLWRGLRAPWPNFRLFIKILTTISQDSPIQIIENGRLAAMFNIFNPST